jgi:hypothetical protein
MGKGALHEKCIKAESRESAGKRFPDMPNCIRFASVPMFGVPYPAPEGKGEKGSRLFRTNA